MPLSQRVEGFSVWYVSVDGDKEKLMEGTTIGYKKIIDLKNIKTDIIEIQIDDARIAPVISFVGVY